VQSVECSNIETMSTSGVVANILRSGPGDVFFERREMIFCAITQNRKVAVLALFVPSSSALIPMSICTLQCLFSHSFLIHTND
jgi:hypothetical protein